ncbi:glucose-6-phosphate dehydrogenase assembly protein OpcA [Streptomyces hoynatensis]|uniref:Glucose-6-phosphate dehydrogenase assembly protein OpcA n=1 Tax=Streptomyces hoynatensis TaxID=1141874 RepID=A0A3A9YZ76_9ACTN|nr:glucose-6-phosphate dehydrogenase assembly protein OpcA [Streptomyces hoynatensis]RKN41235.1 glucose-6-phosphate dehydrogenase assembly protein OpcA [Streptomyces hoynatensis]
MSTELTDTTSSKINAAIVRARRTAGAPVGMVLTLVIVTDEENAHDALKSARDASTEHPSRILVVIRRPARRTARRPESRLDAEVRVGDDAGTGETVLLRLHGELAAHADSVVLPLLLPDAPVVVWWPVDAPENPARAPLGTLAQRRITDSYAVAEPLAELAARAASYTPGDTDLAWTRLTPWRTMLAAALDQTRNRTITGATIESEPENPSAALLAGWFADRLGVPVRQVVNEGPVVTDVSLHTPEGDIHIHRPEGPVARLSIPGQPTRTLPLKVRSTAELIAEELRRLDPDEAYAGALRAEVVPLPDREVPAGGGESGKPAKGKAGETAAEAKPAKPGEAKPAKAGAGRGRAAAPRQRGSGESAGKAGSASQGAGD